MPKQKPFNPKSYNTKSRRRAVRAAAARPRAELHRRKDAAALNTAAQAAAGESVSDPAVLRAEVARLEAELLAMRDRISELELSADIDPLTDVFNRRAFERELDRAVAHSARYGGSIALIFVDLDGFKSINDRHGHAAGDAMLRGIAASLRANVRASDVVARLGGDEFAVMLWNVTESGALAKAAALETVIAALAVLWDTNTLLVGASAGVAVLARNEAPPDALARADAAMYARKAARRR
jgi:diguanylate cyclase (GGDEF)-like protein